MKKYRSTRSVILSALCIVLVGCLTAQAETSKADKATSNASHGTFATGLNDGGRVA